MKVECRFRWEKTDAHMRDGVVQKPKRAIGNRWNLEMKDSVLVYVWLAVIEPLACQLVKLYGRMIWQHGEYRVRDAVVKEPKDVMA